MTRTLIIITAAILLAGCAQPPPVAVAAPSPKPEPKMAWDKPGASNEEFERTKARCIMYAETNQMRNAWGGPFGHSRLILFTNCMRAEGWVLVPEKRSTP